MKFLNSNVFTDFPKSTQRKKDLVFFINKTEENVERLEKKYMIFQSCEQNMALNKWMNVLPRRLQECVGTRRGEERCILSYGGKI
jgi:hypothetical protein